MAADELVLVAEASVAIDEGTGTGSGTAILHTPRNTYILTCAHILSEDSRKVEVLSSDLEKGKVESTNARVVAKDDVRDLALLRTAKRLPIRAVSLAEKEPEAYDKAYLMSCSDGFFGAASDGYVSDTFSNQGYYLISGGVTIPGGSGGGVFTYDGLLISVQVAIGKTGHLPVPGFCFGVPLSAIRAFLEEFLP